MSQQPNAILIDQEGRIELALEAYTSGQFRSLRRAAAVFNVKHQRLSDRLHGITPRAQTRPGIQKLTATEEQTIVRYILDSDSRGFAPRLCEGTRPHASLSTRDASISLRGTRRLLYRAIGSSQSLRTAGQITRG
jgi:hypothetical protein